MGSKADALVVTGDVMLETKLARSNAVRDEADDGAADGGDLATSKQLFDPRYYVHQYTEAAGAVGLGEVLQQAIVVDPPLIPNIEVVWPKSHNETVKANVEGIRKDFWRSVVECCQFGSNDVPGGKRGPAWRVKTRFGIDRPQPKALENTPCLIPLSVSSASLVVVDHLHQEFFQTEKVWPAVLKEGSEDRWILARWSQPQFDNPSKLWRHLQVSFSGRIAVIISVQHLRLFGMLISESLSWERSVADLWREVERTWTSDFAGCKHAIVSFGTAGAAIFTNNSTDAGETNLSARLIYDPRHVESTWSADYAGEMSGLMRCLTAGVAIELMTSRDRNSLSGVGALAGLVAGRHLLINGFDLGDSPLPRGGTILPGDLAFPTRSVAHVLRQVFLRDRLHPREGEPIEARERTKLLERATDLVQQVENSPDDKAASRVYGGWSQLERLDAWIDAEIPQLTIQPVSRDTVLAVTPPKHPAGWRLIDEQLRSIAKAEDLARTVVRFGTADTLSGFPTLRIGKLLVIDRREMEGLRSVRELITNYLTATAATSPLCIAVLGPAGSGKSFAIKQVAKQLADEAPDRRGFQMEDIAFNLSQFSRPEALADALHRVRDIGISGKTPLVFWDEFDTTFEGELGWLKYFLAPMQDGQFQDRQTVHNVGRAIFVFAGSKYPTMRDLLEASLEPHDGSRPASDAAKPRESNDAASSGRAGHFRGRSAQADREFTEAAKSRKIPDFISRLKGSVDVLTLDYEDGRDVAVMLRRAELLHAFLRDGPADLAQVVQRESDGKLVTRLNVDKGIINAFLEVRSFRYGARSIEAIVKMSALHGKAMYERSSLPLPSQIKLHVSRPEEFLEALGSGWADPAGEKKRTQGRAARKG
jgi:hypothetical protein